MQTTWWLRSLLASCTPLGVPRLSFRLSGRLPTGWPLLADLIFGAQVPIYSVRLSISLALGGAWPFHAGYSLSAAAVDANFRLFRRRVRRVQFILFEGLAGLVGPTDSLSFRVDFRLPLFGLG